MTPTQGDGWGRGKKKKKWTGGMGRGQTLYPYSFPKDIFIKKFEFGLWLLDEKVELRRSVG